MGQQVDAASLLTSLSSFDFIITFITLYMYEFMSHLSGVTIKLQSSTMDILSAHEEIQEVKDTYLTIAEKMDEKVHKIYTYVERIAGKVNVQPSMPRVVGRQIHRSNVPSTNPEDYYRKNMGIPFVSLIRIELDAQFSGLNS